MKLVFRQFLVYLGYLMAIAIVEHFAPQDFAANGGRVVKLLLVIPSAFVCLMWLASYAKLIKTLPLKLWVITMLWACVPQNIYLSDLTNRSTWETLCLYVSYGVYGVAFLKLSRQTRSLSLVLVTILVELAVLRHTFFQDGTHSPIKLIAFAAIMPIVGMVLAHGHEKRESMRMAPPIAKEDQPGKEAK